MFPTLDLALYAPENVPGAVVVGPDPGSQRIQLNLGRECLHLRVQNRGDRPVSVGSHYHFLETNPFLAFNCAKA
ncbi:hypothetical protein V8D89_008839 [Ganoderma adspersum]